MGRNSGPRGRENSFPRAVHNISRVVYTAGGAVYTVHGACVYGDERSFIMPDTSTSRLTPAINRYEYECAFTIFFSTWQGYVTKIEKRHRTEKNRQHEK